MAFPHRINSRPTSVSVIAIDVPKTVDIGTDGYKRLTFRGFEAVAVEAVRELNSQVNVNSKEAMGRIEELERQNAELRHAIEVLSDAVKSLQPRLNWPHQPIDWRVC